MNRTEYEAVVNRPGKFEGEAPYVPYYWEHSLDGCELELFDPWIGGFTITQEDADLWPELTEHIGKIICLEESDTGFVYGTIVDQTMWNELEALRENDSDE